MDLLMQNVNVAVKVVQSSQQMVENILEESISNVRGAMTSSCGWISIEFDRGKVQRKVKTTRTSTNYGQPFWCYPQSTGEMQGLALLASVLQLCRDVRIPHHLHRFLLHQIISKVI